MFADRRVPRQVKGRPITADLLNTFADILERLQRLGCISPLAMRQTAGGPQLYWAGPITELRIAQAVGGSVPARVGNKPGKAKGVFVFLDPNAGTLVNSIDQDDLYNLSLQAVGGGYLIVGLILSKWFVLWEDCPGKGN